MARGFHVPDGNEALRADIPTIVELIERTARWVHPDTFRALPLWAPQGLEDGRCSMPAGRADTRTPGRRQASPPRSRGNTAALDALVAALDVASPQPKNWTVCHIWGL